ncbi:hypothetical protein [Noviherbaspirillum galbum]|uniref:Uncharacterized protein n=1 Tax=Noviherbaspirillum galbum TaxID=2709383 RepID=A0A6B3SZS4_9BURK|nr:hypothetical protein [Noviherbaspirillum galbum]NEX64499.1 hypothetical protein [Noviherbaspirillum galbum]
MMPALSSRLFDFAYKQDVTSSIRTYLERALGRVESIGVLPSRANATAPLDIYLQPGLDRDEMTVSRNCGTPTEDEWAIWGIVADRVNAQFKDWNIPATFHLDPKGLTRYSQGNGVALYHCGNMNGGFFVQDGRHIGRIFLQDDGPTSIYVHELAHTTSLHPQDVVSKDGFNLLRFPERHGLAPDFMEAICEPGAHGMPASKLIYNDACVSRGYGLDERQRDTDGDGFGPLELIQSKLRLSNPGAREDILKEGTDYLVGWLHDNFGAKVAGYFAAAMCKEVIDLLGARAISRLNCSPTVQRGLNMSLRVVSSIVQCALMGQPLTGMAMGAASLCLQSVLMQRTLHALAGLVGGEAIQGMLVLGLGRGNWHAVVGLVSAFAGRHAGQALAETCNILMQCCSRDNSIQREAYLDLVNDPNRWLRCIGTAMAKTRVGQQLDKVDRCLSGLLSRLRGHSLYECLYREPERTRQNEVNAAAADTLREVIVIAGNDQPKGRRAPVAAQGRRAGAAPASPTVKPLTSILIHRPGEAQPPATRPHEAAARSAYRYAEDIESGLMPR